MQTAFAIAFALARRRLYCSIGEQTENAVGQLREVNSALPVSCKTSTQVANFEDPDPRERFGMRIPHFAWTSRRRLGCSRKRSFPPTISSASTTVA